MSTESWENASVVAKANMVVGDLTSGGKLAPDQVKEFLRVAIKKAVFLVRCTVTSMTTPERELPNLKFAGQVLHAGTSGRAVAVGDRSKPTLAKVTLSTKLFKGQVRVDDEVFEDNIERQALNQTILATLGEAVGRDMENAAINGDTTSTNSLLSQFDGFLKQAASNLVNAGDVKLTRSVLRDLMKTLPIEYRQDPRALRFITSFDAEVDYRDGLGDRMTPGGDSWLTQGTAPVAYGGIEVVPIPIFPQDQGSGTNETSVLICDPKNPTVGVQRDVKIETWRDPDAGQVVFSVSLRMDAKFAYEPAVAKATNVRIS